MEQPASTPFPHAAMVPLRRSIAALLGCIIAQNFPDATLVGGGLTDIGFYYDAIFSQPLHGELLPTMEAWVKTLAKSSPELRSLSMMRENGAQLLLHHHHPMLAAAAAASDSNIISLIQIGSHYDLCPEPHLLEPSDMRCLKLLNVEVIERELPSQECIEVTRISGTAFSNPQQLKRFSKAFELWKRCDHCTLGPQLNLFSFIKLEGEIRTLWHPKGERLRQQLLALWMQENRRLGAVAVSTPTLLQKGSYSSLMTQHLQLYKACSMNAHEARFSESMEVVAAEKSQEEAGLLRNRFYTMDWVTTFCRAEQLQPELISFLQFVEKTATLLNFRGHWQLIGSDPLLLQALKHCQLAYSAEVEAPKGIKPYLQRWNIDALGREWPGAAAALYKLAGGLFAVGRTLYGSLDRTVALLVESTEGSLPLWIAPEQVRIISMGTSSRAYGENVARACEEQGLRVTLDSREEKLAVRVHSAESEKIPCIITVGEREEKQQLVSVRHRCYNGSNQTIKLKDFIEGMVKSLES